MPPLLEELLRRVQRRRRTVWLAHAAVAAGALAVALFLCGLGEFAMLVALVPLLARGARPAASDPGQAPALVAALDRHFPELEDSAALLLRADPPQPPLEARQRERVERRLQARLDAGHGLEDLLDEFARAGPAPRTLALAGVLVAAALLWWPRAWAPPPRLELEVEPPAYLEEASFRAPGPELEVPAGSVVTWRLRGLAPGREARFSGNGSPPRAMGADADVTLAVERDLVYRVEWDAADGQAAIAGVVTVQPDRPPELTLLAPTRWPVEFRDPDPGGLPLRLAAEDDRGVSRAALLLTVARGEGEAVKFRERRRKLALPDGPGPLQFDLQLSPRELGMEPGDELYAQFEVQDSRRPEPGVSRSPTVVFRWLGGDEPAVSLAGMPVDRMPDYFRSQRQIIIDTERLLEDRGTLDAESFRERSQALARDQRALRLRYGQYLGEEAESGAGPNPAEAGEAHPPDDAHGAEHGHGHGHGEGHDHGEPEPPGGSDDDGGDILELFGHSHDYAEQATLFDPKTRATLKQALAAMWQAELQLGLNAPDQALEPEHEALDRLKAVQQANRIYVKRVGFEPPPLSEERRLSGEFQAAAPTAPAREMPAPELPRRALAGLLAADPGDGSRDRLLGELAAAEGYPGELRLAAERLRVDPGCDACRRTLLTQLWELAEPPPPPTLGPALPASPAAARRYGERRSPPADPSRP